MEAADGRRNEDDESELSISRQDLARIRGRAERAERKLEAIEKSKAWRIVRGYWNLREQARGRASSEAVVRQSSAPNLAPAPSQSIDIEPQLMSDALQSWIERAREAGGDDVVVMFTTGSTYDSRRATRSCQLARVYLDQECPVFFNFDRTDSEPQSLAELGGLLFQSPAELTSHLLARLLESEFGAKQKVLFVSFPGELMVRYMLYASQHGWKVVYDVQQDWEEVARVGAAGWYEPAYEWYLARHADLVTAVAWPLAKKIGGLCDRPIVINANALDKRLPPRTVALAAGRQVIGFLGNMNQQWFDWDLLVRCARRHPEIKFQLAGHHAPVGRSDLENIELLGMLTHEEIADASACWTAAIAPFKIGPMTDARDPIEVYSYLHLRLPVLVTYMPQLLSRPGVIVAESSDLFIAAIPNIVELGEQEPQRSDEWLAANTWELRVEAYRAELATGTPPRPLLDYLLQGGS